MTTVISESDLIQDRLQRFAYLFFYFTCKSHRNKMIAVGVSESSYPSAWIPEGCFLGWTQEKSSNLMAIMTRLYLNGNTPPAKHSN